MNKNETTVKTVDIDLNEILGTGADSVITASENNKEEKKSIFSPLDNVDTTFLDNKDGLEIKEVDNTSENKAETNTEATGENKEPEKKVEDVNVDDLLAPPTNEEIESDLNELEELKNKGGRPTALVAAAKSMIEKGTLLPFDDGKNIDEYTAADFEELIEANFNQTKSNLIEELPTQFLQSLPREMQQAYEYIANGGTDLKGMFSALASTTEVRDYDVTNTEDQKAIIRTYLNSTQFGTPEEIEDEIYSYEDRSELEKKAMQFKPKLDAVKEREVQAKIKQQEENAKIRQQLSQQYVNNVFTALDKPDLNGLPLDNKTQNMLYAGLVQNNYPSKSGNNTNMLGHLLEKYQWEEPRHDLIAEALWLLADPDGYKNNIKTVVSKSVNEETVRKLKTEQSNKNTSSQAPEAKSDNSRTPRRTISKPKKGFFQR